MEKVLFKKGEQRKFLGLAIKNLGGTSLRGILQFGFEVKYSSLKNYYVERRLIGREFYEDLCRLAGIEIDEFDVKYVEGNWGQIKGGKLGRKNKPIGFKI